MPLLFPFPAQVRKTTRRDILTVTVCTILLLCGLLIIWHTSDARSSSLQKSPQAISQLHQKFPQSNSSVNTSQIILKDSSQLSLEWTHEKEPGPIAVDSSTILIPDSQGATAYSVLDGAQLWSYHRKNTLCALSTQNTQAYFTFRGPAGCGQTSIINIPTGEYSATRSSEAPNTILPHSSGGYVGYLSPEHMELWREDAIRTFTFGKVYAVAEPEQITYPGCTLRSSEGNKTILAVLLYCPAGTKDNAIDAHPLKQDEYILSFQNPKPEDSREPEELRKVVLNDYTYTTAERGTISPELILTRDEYALFALPGDAATGRKTEFLRISSTGHKQIFPAPEDSESDLTLALQELSPEDTLFSSVHSENSFTSAWTHNGVTVFFHPVTLAPVDYSPHTLSNFVTSGASLLGLVSTDNTTVELVSVSPDLSIATRLALPDALSTEILHASSPAQLDIQPGHIIISSPGSVNIFSITT